MDLGRYQSLAGRSVFVTGGSSGIGASIVEAFARQQSKVAFVGRDAVAARLVVSNSSQHGPAPLFLSCDLLDIAALRKAIAQAAGANGPVTVLINNAASDDRHATAEVTPDYWDERMRINLRHQFFAIQTVAPTMRDAHGGAVVNIGSNAWMMKHAFYPGYAAAKAAVLGLTRAMAGELGPDNIRVNCISPGWTFTERQLRLWWSAEKEAALMQRQCLKHRIVPEDVAAAVLFLASDDARSITGQNLVVDCGES